MLKLNIAPPVQRPEETETNVTPAGRVSETVTAPALAGPLLATVSVYVKVAPDATFAGADLVIATSACVLVTHGRLSEEARERLDRFVELRLPAVSRGRIRAAIVAGRVAHGERLGQVGAGQRHGDRPGGWKTNQSSLDELFATRDKMRLKPGIVDHARQSAENVLGRTLTSASIRDAK